MQKLEIWHWLRFIYKNDNVSADLALTLHSFEKNV
jgi:hypothetical protein